MNSSTACATEQVADEPEPLSVVVAPVCVCHMSSAVTCKPALRFIVESLNECVSHPHLRAQGLSLTCSASLLNPSC